MNSMLIEFGAPTLLYGYDIIFTQPKDHELQIFQVDTYRNVPTNYDIYDEV